MPTVDLVHRICDKFNAPGLYLIRPELGNMAWANSLTETPSIVDSTRVYRVSKYVFLDRKF
jgi:hypothetical protein